MVDELARGLGWFSLALGGLELVAAGTIARTLGLEGKETLIRAYGLREIGAGVGVLMIDPKAFMAARVAGDVLDLATLAVGLGGTAEQRRNTQLAGVAVAAITVLDAYVAGVIGHQSQGIPYQRSNTVSG